MDESDKLILKELEENGWYLCSKLNCKECSIELNCPFDNLITLQEAHDVLNEAGYLVLQGIPGMWGVFRKEDAHWYGEDKPLYKLRIVPEKEWVPIVDNKIKTCVQ